ncbi:hypothetical protein EYB25_005196 [Talaromyces marneffei]|uniref:uncharacterized protein n=1 Tax=Talaromyces marneffei TaxID=37727 RepID=UPI0012A7C6FF|nr:uncharacterized protein EYB26_007508 [Talaromyces marneffei]KAE8551312.1 hypothetical protein EYB25_005196 [Talaromyces marneffei]QGA19813.1 hypothetical protein EYB26_007508 [Talaromyces marneffei]
MDFMTYPTDRNGYDTVFVVVDRFSKIPISIPCHKTVTAKDLARLWVLHLYRRTGPPDTIVSDRGPQFVSEFWGEVCKILGIQIVLSTADHAQTDGQTEIANQYLSQRLRPYVSYFQDDWSEWLPIIDFAAAVLPQETTGLSPFMIEKGFQPRVSFDWKEPESPQRLTINEQEGREWVNRMHKIWEFARSNILNSQLRQKAQADKHRREVDFEVGDDVMVTNRNWSTGRPSRKLGHQAEGPYKIIEKVGNSFKLNLPEGMNVHPVFSPDKLRLATRTEPLPGQVIDSSPPVLVNGDQEWEVHEILDSRVRWKKLYYRVQWLGHDPDPKWYPAENFSNAPRRLQEFHNRYPEKPGPPELLEQWLEEDLRA